MEYCKACDIRFPDKFWLDKHNLSPQHIYMQMLMDSDHSYATPLPYSLSVGNAGNGKKIGSSQVSVSQSGSMDHNFQRESAGPSTSVSTKQKMMGTNASKKRLAPGSGVITPQETAKYFEGIHSGARAGNSAQGRAAVLPPNHQRTSGAHLTDRQAAPGGPQVGRPQQNSSIAATARIPVRKTGQTVVQRDGAGTQRKTLPFGWGAVPPGNQEFRRTLEKALQGAPVSKKRQLELERQHEAYRAFDYMIPPPKKSLLAAAGWGGKGGKAPAQKKMLVGNDRFPALQSALRESGIHSSPKQPSSGGAVASTSSSFMKSNMKSAEFADGCGKVVTKAAVVQSSKSSGGKSVRFIDDLGNAVTKAAEVQSFKSSGGKLGRFVDGRGNAVTKAAEVQSFKSSGGKLGRFVDGRGNSVFKVQSPKAGGGKSALQTTNPNPVKLLNPIQSFEKKVEDQTSSDGNPSKLDLGHVVASQSSSAEVDTKSGAPTAATVSAGGQEEVDAVDVAKTVVSPLQTVPATAGLVTSTTSGANLKSEDSDREADLVALEFHIKTREDYIEAASHNLGSNPDFNLNPIEPSTENMEEEQSSSNKNLTELGPDAVVTSTSSVMETDLNSAASEVGSEMVVVDQTAESVPSLTTKEDGEQVPPQQNSSNQPIKPVVGEIIPTEELRANAAAPSARLGDTVVSKSVAARMPPKRRRKAPARKKKSKRCNRIQASSTKGKDVSTSPNAKSTKRSPGGIVPCLSASGRGAGEIVNTPTEKVTRAKRVPPPKPTKGLKRLRKVTQRQLNNYVPTMLGKNYKMPRLSAVAYCTDEGGIQKWICLVCNQKEPLVSSRPMVSCEICYDWYHFGCVGIYTQIPKEDPWYCRRCIHRSESSARKT